MHPDESVSQFEISGSSLGVGKINDDNMNSMINVTGTNVVRNTKKNIESQ